MKGLTLISCLVFCSFFYHQVHGGGVSQCYHCKVACSDPLGIENCANMVADMSCYSATILQDGREEYTKGCTLSDDPFMMSECEAINNMEGSSCYICNTNLCNESK